MQESTSKTGEKKPLTVENRNHAILTLERRLRALKIKKGKVTPKGSNRVLVSVNDLTEAEVSKIRTTFIELGKLELKEVHPESRALADKAAADPENKIIPGYQLKVLKDTDQDGNPTTENILIKCRAALDGSYIVHAQELYGPYEGQLNVELNSEGADKMLAVTQKMEHGRDRLAIILDGKVLSAPVVQSPLSKKFQISGLSNAKEAKVLASTLLNPLRNPLIIEEERRVSSHLLTDPAKQAAP